MKILMLSSRIPYPLTAGFRIRIYNEAKHFKQNGHSVDILFLGETGEYESELHEVFDNVYPIPFSKAEIGKNLVGALFSGLPMQVALYRNDAFMKKLLEIQDGYDVVIGNHIRTAEYLKKLDNNKVVLDLHDAISYNYSNAIKVEKGLKKLIYKMEYGRVLKYEKDVIDRFGRVVLISENDAKWLKKNGADTSGITFIPVAVRDDIKNVKTDYAKDENSICFLGKMSYQPNEDAVLWFARNVLPVLTEKHPNLTFYVMGTEPTKEVLKLNENPFIKVTGFIENPYEIIAKSKVTVAPIRNGAGIQNKVLESMVVGTPVVASKIAAAGISGINGYHLLVADDEKEFENEISHILGSEKYRRQVGIEGRNYVNENFTWNVLSQKWENLIRKNNDNQ